MTARILLAFALGAFVLPCSGLEAQARTAPTTGPVIEGYGPVFEVEGLAMPAPTDVTYRALFDITGGASAPGELNQDFDSVARFINMHARAGVPLELIDVAVVIHGAAGRDALQEGPFRERFDAGNPNAELLRRLEAAGVKLYVCGQSAMARGYAADEFVPGITMALSAMTVRVLLQSEGYEVVR